MPTPQNPQYPDPMWDEADAYLATHDAYLCVVRLSVRNTEAWTDEARGALAERDHNIGVGSVLDQVSDQVILRLIKAPPLAG